MRLGRNKGLTLVAFAIVLGSTGCGGGNRQPATRARLNRPSAVAVAADGTLYIADTGNHRVCKVDRRGIITTVAGTGRPGYTGDGGPARLASLNHPCGVAVGSDGCIYIADRDNNRVRRISTDGTITTIAGDGWGSERTFWGRFAGDGGQATKASLWSPQGIGIGRDGTLYIADTDNGRIRSVSHNGLITTVAGNGRSLNPEEGANATQTGLWPLDLACDGKGNLYAATHGKVNKIDTAGIIRTVAGADPDNGHLGFADGVPATSNVLRGAWSISLGRDGSIYIAEEGLHRVRKVDPTGMITTVAGDGYTRGAGRGRYRGDGGPATNASLSAPRGVAVGPDGSIYIADTGNNRVRRVDPKGVITTVAGG